MLSIIDCRVGTIVDHTHERREDGKIVLRPVRRRGIIVDIVGNGTDSVTGVKVKFKIDQEPEAVDSGELVRVYPATSRVAREAYRRIMGQPKHVGAEFAEKKVLVRPRIQDSLALTEKAGAPPVVIPQMGTDEDIAGMPLEDTGA